MVIFGKSGCPCINSTATLTSLTDRQCLLSPSGNAGVRLTNDDSCVPFSYGATQCLQHDLLHDPTCRADLLAGEHIVPAHCFRPWCFVDAATCGKDSDERAFRSSYFSFDSGVDLFYSYSTCNSTAGDWFEAEGDIIQPSDVLGGISITASIPTYLLPMMYKRDVNGEILPSVGAEYYNDSIPFEGVYMKYIKQIIKTSNGDIGEVKFTHRSKASSHVHPTSSYTAAVQDINDGLVDLAVGPFWVTAERLKLSSFTLPILYDKIFLVIPRPKDTLGDHIKKVWQPFSVGLWAIVLGIIVSTALLKVWFNEELSKMQQNRRQNDDRRRALQGEIRPRRSRRKFYARLALDSFLEQGLFFCSAGVEQDKTSSLPVKLLLFGFGFFILISVSAYVANLAAYLTLSGTSNGVKTMEEAEKKGVTICAHPALETDIVGTWPSAKFYFHKDANEFRGMLDDYDAKKCEVMAVGYEDTSMDEEFLQAMCERELLYTNSVVVEKAIALPARSSVGTGFSYWGMETNKRGVTLQATKDEFFNFEECNVHFSEETARGAEEGHITERNMFFPIMFFVFFAAVAVILHMTHLSNVKKGKKSILGRRSSLTVGTPRKDVGGRRRHGREHTQGKAMEGIPEEDDKDQREHGQEQDGQIPGSHLHVELADERTEFPKAHFCNNNKHGDQGSRLFQKENCASGRKCDFSFSDFEEFYFSSSAESRESSS